MEGIREFTCKEGLLLKEEQKLGKWKKRWMVLRVNERGDPSLYYYQVDDYINECMPLGFVVPSCCTLFEYPAKNFSFELVAPPSYNGLSPRPATHFRFQATNLDEFKAWISVLSLYTMPIEEMYNAARNGIEPIRSHSCESFIQSPLTRSPTNIRSKEWEDNEAMLMKLFPDVELQTIVEALEFCRGNRNDAIDLLAEQNKLSNSNSTNNRNLTNGFSPHSEMPAGHSLKRAKSMKNLADSPSLISTPSPFISPSSSSSSQLPKELLNPPLPPLSLDSLSLSSYEILPSLPVSSDSIIKPKPLRNISPSHSQSISLSSSVPASPSHSRLHAPIVPLLPLPLPQTYESENTYSQKNQQGQKSQFNQHVYSTQEENEKPTKIEHKEIEQQQQQFVHLHQLLQKKENSPTIPPIPSTPSTPSIPSTPSANISSTRQSPSYKVSSSLPSTPSLPPALSQHYLYYNQQQKENYQPLASPNSPPSSLSSSSQHPHISISLQSTPRSPLSPLSPRSPHSSTPTSPTSASPSPRLHHNQYTPYRYANFRSAPMMGHSTLPHFEAYSSPDLTDDSSSYHSPYSHTGFGGHAYSPNGSPNNSGGLSPSNSSPNYGNFHQAVVNSQNRSKPINPVSFRIVGATRNTYYMDYIVEVVTPELRWLVYRRYSNFSLLNSKMVKLELAHPSKNVMPPKQFSLPPFPPAFASDELVNKRVETLGLYLNSLVEHNSSNATFFLNNPIGQAFINPHISSNEHNKFVNNLPN